MHCDNFIRVPSDRKSKNYEISNYFTNYCDIILLQLVSAGAGRMGLDERLKRIE
jgi:hypothetical protein